uniref:LAGLIDADG homing endonuclease n=1 Tax=Romanomermis culicivorax TaxID=13658 RepID=A0A915HVA6_ROMCU
MNLSTLIFFEVYELIGVFPSPNKSCCGSHLLTKTFDGKLGIGSPSYCQTNFVLGIDLKVSKIELYKKTKLRNNAFFYNFKHEAEFEFIIIMESMEKRFLNR